MQKQQLTEIEESGLSFYNLTIESSSQNSDYFRLGIAWALKKHGIVDSKLACKHKWIVGWAHRDCEKCGSVSLGTSRQDREDYGIAAGKIFKNMEYAKFFQNNGKLPN